MPFSVRSTTLLLAALALFGWTTPVAAVSGTDAGDSASTQSTTALVQPPRLPAASESQGLIGTFMWHELGSNGAGNGAITGTVRAIAVMGNNVFVGGNFTDAAGIGAADYIARWNGSGWSALGSYVGGGVLSGPVSALQVIGTDLYVGGSFSNAGGMPTADYVAKWSNNTWSAVGSDGTGDGALNSGVNALAAVGTVLYAGGTFTDAANITIADKLARWSDNAWSAVGSNGAGGPALANTVRDLAVSGTNLYVGGEFSNAGGVATADAIAKWSNGAWSGLGSNGSGNGIFYDAVNMDVYTVAVDGSNVYVGGNFIDLGADPIADYIASWNGSAWGPVGSNGAGGPAMNTIVHALTFAGGSLYAGGSFVGQASYPTGDYLARWNQSVWSGVGSNDAGTDGALGAAVYAVTVNGDHVYAGGDFQNAAGIATADRVARYGPPISYQPDGRIKKGSGTLVGNDIYNGDGTNQTRVGKKATGGTLTFTISIQNDGTDDDQVSVYATGVAAANYQVSYFSGTTEITGQVVTGTYKTPFLAPGATFPIKAKVKVLAGAAIGSSVTRMVYLNSAADPAKQDVVKFTCKRK
jgi:hypothetical protein